MPPMRRFLWPRATPQKTPTTFCVTGWVCRGKQLGYCFSGCDTYGSTALLQVLPPHHLAGATSLSRGWISLTLEPSARITPSVFRMTGRWVLFFFQSLDTKHDTIVPMLIAAVAVYCPVRGLSNAVIPLGFDLGCYPCPHADDGHSARAAK